MQTILVGLLSGFVVGVVCVLYVFVRTTRFISPASSPKPGGDPLRNLPYSESLTSSGLMFMAVAGSGSLLWGFIGAGIYHIIRDDGQFFLLSAGLAIIVSAIIWLSKTTFAIDKMVLSAVILVGLGLLIPWLI